MWGIDIALNYLKEINNASCPWRTSGSSHGAVPASASQGSWEVGGISQHPEFEKEIYTIDC